MCIKKHLAFNSNQIAPPQFLRIQNIIIELIMEIFFEHLF